MTDRELPPPSRLHKASKPIFLVFLAAMIVVTGFGFTNHDLPMWVVLPVIVAMMGSMLVYVVTDPEWERSAHPHLYPPRPKRWFRF